MIKALHKYVIVKRNESAETKTKGGLIAPAAKGGTDTATVLDIGPGVGIKDGGPNICVGDTVVVTRLTGSDVSIDRETYTIVTFEDILAVVREEESDSVKEK